MPTPIFVLSLLGAVFYVIYLFFFFFFSALQFLCICFGCLASNFGIRACCSTFVYALKFLLLCHIFLKVFMGKWCLILLKMRFLFSLD